MASQQDMMQGGRTDLPLSSTGERYKTSMLYRPDEDPKTALEVLSRGDGLAAVASAMDISFKTLHNWRSKFPELEEAIQIGLVKAQHWWEEKAKEHLILTEDKMGPKTTFNTKIYTHTMAVRFNQRENAQPIQILVGENGDADKVNDLVKRLHKEEI